MAAKLAPTDLALNFMGFDLALDAVDSSVIRNVEVPTGISHRSGIAMLIHRVEYEIGALVETDNRINMALSSRAGLAAQVNLNDDGCIDLCRIYVKLTTSGLVLLEVPIIHTFLPPIIYASPKIVFYASASPDAATMQGATVRGRIGFTTVPMTPELYREIAETWGW